MDPEELELCQCAECDAAIDVHADRYYVFSDEGVLCFECAIRRGGQYDEDNDAWLVPPDVFAFADERRPHA